jgi:cytochrome c
MLVGAFALVAAGAHAQDGSALLTSNGCMNCHAMDSHKVGPAFTDVADQYRGNATAEATLVAKLRDGAGHPKIAAPEASIKSMVDFVLSIK